MKSPLPALVIYIVGLAVAGVLLRLLTHLPAQQAAGVPGGEPRASRTLPVGGEEPWVDVPVLVYCTGTPSEINILREGDLLVRISAVHDGEWQGNLRVPQPHRGSTLELEVQAHWPGEPSEMRTVTLESTPAHLPKAQDTHRAAAGEQDLHTVFYLRW